MSKKRIAIGAVVSPLAVALLWSVPAMIGGISAPWIIFSIMGWLLSFLIFATASHFFLKWKQWAQLRRYTVVMFTISTVTLLLTRLVLVEIIFGNGGSEFHSGTQVIDKGHFTFSGIVLTLVESMFAALWFTAAFALFWFIAIRPEATADGQS